MKREQSLIEGRGKIVTTQLKKGIVFNSNTIMKCVIEIDHINYGINKETKELNKKKRTDFSVKDVEKFIMLLDGEILMPEKYKGRISQFSIRVDCPIKGKFLGKEFVMIFDTNYDKQDEIHTITLFPGW